jgi:hypothetical protein
VAGLVPYKDYLLGTTTATLDSTETLAHLLKAHRDRVVELYVYNSDSDVVRVVALLPTLSWGGGVDNYRGGLLGASVGTGYLHRLPSSTRHTEGVSVERKVRYVGSVTRGGRDEASSPAPRAAVIPALGGAGAAAGNGDVRGTAMLELEPQLEMEREESSCDDASAAEELSSVALSVENETTSRAPASPSASARGVVVETVANEHEEEDDGALHRQQGKLSSPRLADPSALPSSSWMEPVSLQERESSSSGRTSEEPEGDSLVGRDAAAAHRMLPEPPLSPSVAATTAATTAAAASPPVKAALGFGFLPPPPKMHYGGST